MEITQYVDTVDQIMEGGADNGYELPPSNWDPATEPNHLVHPMTEPMRNRPASDV